MTESRWKPRADEPGWECELGLITLYVEDKGWSAHWGADEYDAGPASELADSKREAIAFAREKLLADLAALAALEPKPAQAAERKDAPP